MLIKIDSSDGVAASFVAPVTEKESELRLSLQWMTVKEEIPVTL
jgi:hypothetical protein